MSGGLDVVSSADGGFGARLDAFCDNMTPEAAIALLKEIQGDKPEIQLKSPTEAHEVTARFEVQQAVTLTILQRGPPPPPTAWRQIMEDADAASGSLYDGAGPSELRSVVESMGGLKTATGFPMEHVTATSRDQSRTTFQSEHSAAQGFFIYGAAEISPLQTEVQNTELAPVDDGLNIWDLLPDASAWVDQIYLSTNSTEFEQTPVDSNKVVEDADHPLPQIFQIYRQQEVPQVRLQDTAGPQEEGHALGFQTSSETVSQPISRSPPTVDIPHDPLKTSARPLAAALAPEFHDAQRSLDNSPPSTPPELTSGPTSDEDGDHNHKLGTVRPKKTIKRKRSAGGEEQGLADSVEPARRRKRRASQDYAKDMEAAGSSLIQFPVNAVALKPPEAYGIDANATALSQTSDGQSIGHKMIKKDCPWVLDARNAEKREPCNAEISGNGLNDFIKNLQNHIFIAHNPPLGEQNTRQRYLCRALLDTAGKALCPSRITTGVPYQCRLATHIAREHLDIDVPKNYNPNAPGSA